MGLTRFQLRSAMLRSIDSSGGAGPWRTTPGLWDAFHDDDDLLTALQHRWHTTLVTCLQAAIENGAGEVVDDVRAAWHATVLRHPGLRQILDAHREHPSIADAIRRERAMLARAADVDAADEIVDAVASI